MQRDDVLIKCGNQWMNLEQWNARKPRNFSGRLLLWWMDSGYPMLLAAIIGVLGLAVTIGTMWGMCVIAGVCQ